MDIQCPRCGAPFTVPDGIAGKKARCGACKTVFRAPALAAPADEYELESPLEEIVASLPPTPSEPPRRLPPDNPEDEVPLSAPLRIVVFVGEFLPGLFRPKTLILSILCGVIGLAIMGLAVFIAFVGAIISAFSIGALGLICYAQALAMLLHGEAALLSEALSELNSWQWILFILLVSAPFGAAFMILGGAPAR